MRRAKGDANMGLAPETLAYWGEVRNSRAVSVQFDARLAALQAAAIPFVVTRA